MIVDLTRHLDRLDRSLGELRIAWPMSRAALIHVIRETLRRNHVRNGLFYLQVTRGVARRDHVFPAEGTPASIVVTAKSTDPSVIAKKNANGIKAITVPDNRWDRVDIKTVGLLSNALARQQAKEAGAQEAIYVDADGMVKEGAATNVWIVDTDGTLVTRPAEHGILRGITRTTLMDVAAKLGCHDCRAHLLRRGDAGGARSLHHGSHKHLFSGGCHRWQDDCQRPSGQRFAENS